MTKKPDSLDTRLQKALKDQDFDAWDLDLALAFSEWADDLMEKRLSREIKKIPRIRDKVKRGVEIRLAILTPYKNHVRSSLRFLSKPLHAHHLPKMVWHSADIIWDAAGDNSTDYNRYTKRLLLSGVLTSTTLYWLRDTSSKNQKTTKFLERRIEDVMKAGQFIARFKKAS